MVLGASLGTLLAGLSLYVLSLPPDSWGVQGAIIVAIVVGGPLLLMMLGATAAVVRKGGQGQLLLVVWLPVLIGGSILPVSAMVASIRRDTLSSQHPPVDEMHVNLTGSTITVGKHIELDGAEPDRFTEKRRFPAFEADGFWRTVYSGHRLAPGFTSAPVHKGTLDRNVPGQLPVVLANSYPDLTNTRSQVEPLFLYYYYSDRVEVAPSFSMSSMGMEALAARGAPVLEIFAHNLGKLAIVRLEVDGHALGLNGAIAPAVDGACRITGKPTLPLANAPLKVRWQYAQPDAMWHEARVTVPAFRSARQPKGKVQRNEVHLYLHADGRVGAQRAQLLELSGSKRAIRFTAPVPAFDAEPPCGTGDNYGAEVLRFAD